MIGSPFERTRSDDCLSDFALDRLVGEREAHPHLDSCERCAARVRELEQARDRFAARAVPLRPKKRAWPSIAGAALAASIAMMFLWPDGDRTGFRTKGGPQLTFYVKHGEQVRRGSDGESVAPKDAIRFAYSAEKPYHLAVFSIDANERVSLYYPSEDGTRPEPPGADIALPLSTILDDSVGKETIWALFCEQPIDLAAIERALESSRAAPELAGCHARTVEWKKER